MATTTTATSPIPTVTPATVQDTPDPTKVTKRTRREANRIHAANSRARTSAFIKNLEQLVHTLTTDKLELQVALAAKTNEVWELNLVVAKLQKQCGGSGVSTTSHGGN
jgi:hypothetical protein